MPAKRQQLRYELRDQPFIVTGSHPGLTDGLLVLRAQYGGIGKDLRLRLIVLYCMQHIQHLAWTPRQDQHHYFIANPSASAARRESLNRSLQTGLARQTYTWVKQLETDWLWADRNAVDREAKPEDARRFEPVQTLVADAACHGDLTILQVIKRVAELQASSISEPFSQQATPSWRSSSVVQLKQRQENARRPERRTLVPLRSNPLRNFNQVVAASAFPPHNVPAGEPDDGEPKGTSLQLNRKDSHHKEKRAGEIGRCSSASSTPPASLQKINVGLEKLEGEVKDVEASGESQLSKTRKSAKATLCTDAGTSAMTGRRLRSRVTATGNDRQPLDRSVAANSRSSRLGSLPARGAKGYPVVPTKTSAVQVLRPEEISKMFMSEVERASRVIQDDSSESDHDPRQEGDELLRAMFAPKPMDACSKGGKRGKKRSSSDDEDDEIASTGVYQYAPDPTLYYSSIIVGWQPGKITERPSGLLTQEVVYQVRIPSEGGRIWSKRRDDLCVVGDEGFNTCILGELEPVVHEDAEKSDYGLRCFTPAPSAVSHVDEQDVSLAAKLQCMREHLQMIIAEEYCRFSESIDTFYRNKGGDTVAVYRGNTPAYAVDRVYKPELYRWVLPEIYHCQHGEHAPRAARKNSTRFNKLDRWGKESPFEMGLHRKALPELVMMCDEDEYPEELRLQPKTELTRRVIVLRALQRKGAEDPDDYTIWSELMEARNRARKEKGLQLEGKPVVDGNSLFHVYLPREQRRKNRPSYIE
ncbi:hypothetical protein QFC24_005325 [Naganishia onofrii]|uniref:Uncharacterized protein n=1 Tax=Naganishia onofrii TaxID=1851511 RepID=A0ACC2X8I7_9TREE|nr:hypothetical protein QFC24_005325 [Naganishia onofrii]